MNIPHFQAVSSRREFLLKAGGGFGSIALTSPLSPDGLASTAAAAKSSKHPFPPLQAKAKSVIWCFMDGGPSHIDLFDPKPALNKLAGKPLPSSFVRPVTSMGRTAYTDLLASQRRFSPHGHSGAWVSDWYPAICSCVDDLAILRSCLADG